MTSTPKQKNKSTIALVVGAVLVVVFLAVGAVLFSSLGSHWPQVPPPELYVIKQPKLEDISGSYLLIKQTITTNGLSFLEGRQCQLNLMADGSFAVTNYPRWLQTASAKAPSAEFISTTGRWHCETIGIAYSGSKGNQYFGIVFSDSSAGMDAVALRSNGSPYDLMLTYGDADEGLFMTFGKR